MKKYSFFAAVFLLIFAIGGLAQGPTLLTHESFESGIPTGWTVSSSSSVTIHNGLAATGTKSVRLQPAAAEVTLTSPVYTIQAGCATRLEFSHIPILNNQNGGRVEVKRPDGTWTTLTLQSAVNPSCYDPSYGAGVSGFDGSFKKVSYWSGNTNIPVGDLDSSYWRNEIFYLFTTLTSSATQVQFRFVLPASSGAAANFSGWFIDDVRLFVASTAGDEMRVPQIRSIVKAPTISNYPTCSDVTVQMQIRDAGGAMSTASDAVKIEIMQPDEDGTLVPTTVNMTSVGNDTYEGNIPFNGFGKQTYWRVIAADAKGNEIRYPYVYGTYNKYTIIRPFEGARKVKETGTSNQELMIPTNKLSSMFQMRYSAQELLDAGMRAGEIGGLYYTVSQSAAGYIMPNFKLSIGNISPDWVLDGQYQYSASVLQQVYSTPTFVTPPIGEHYIEFDQPILWDGVSDIMIKTCWGATQTAGGVTKVECIPTSGNYRTGQFTQTGTSYSEACTAPFNSADPLINYKVNFRFNFIQSCVLPVDAALSSKLAVPADQKVTANTNSNFGVYIRNDGSEALSQVKVSYLSDDGASGNSTWTGTLASGDSTVFNVTNALSLTPGFRKVTAWSNILPPDVDWNTDNDTMVYEIVSCDGPMNGVYAVGNVSGVANTRTFEDFRQVFKMLEVCGVGAPVTVRVNPGENMVCGDVLKFPSNIQGASTANTITFTSHSATQPVIFYVNDTVKGATTSFDLSDCKFLKFENCTFLPAKYYTDNSGSASAVRNVVQLSQGSRNIEFKNCNFPAAVTIGEAQSVFGLVPTSLLELSAASNVTVDSCRFGNVASRVINVKGLSPASMSSGIAIRNNTFNYEAVTVAGASTVSDEVIYVEYNDGLVLSKNKFNATPDRPTVGGEKYAVMLQSSKNFNVNKNEFKLEKITAISLSQILSGNSIVVNNKIGVNNTNTGVGNIHISGIKLLSGEGVSIVYNSIYALDEAATGKLASGLNLGSQGQTSSGIIVKNNAVVSEGAGYASWLKPSSEDVSASFTLSNNMYYKVPSEDNAPMFRINTANIPSSLYWQTQTSETASIYDENPFFNAWNDLNTTNTSLCAMGVPIDGVTDDFFGRPRPATAPCIGALEFLPPTNNIYVMSASLGSGTYSETEDGVPMYTSCDFGQETISVLYKNISSNTIPANQARMVYKVGTSAPVQGSLIDHTIEPNVEYTYTFTQTANLSATNADTRHDIRVYSSLTADTVNTNDTVGLIAFANYQLPAMAPQSIDVNYGDAATLNVVSNDSVYWFRTMEDDEVLAKTHSLVTAELYSDTVFYFSRKQEIPVLKITELQFNRTATVEQGITSPLPAWVTTANAYEICNLGNGEMDMTGYKFVYYSGTSATLSASPTKNYNFPDGYILPANSSVVLLPVNATAVDEPGVLGIGTGTVTATRKTGFILKDAADNVIDAVTVNGASFASGHNVPNNIWHGASPDLSLTGTAGVVRNGGTSATQADWNVASSEHPMTIGTYNSGLTVHSDNGCQGFRSSFTVNIQNIPMDNPGIAEVRIDGMEADSACTLGNEYIKVKITNMGANAVSNIPIHYYSMLSGTVVEQKTDTYTGTINSFDTVEYVLSEPLDLSSLTSDSEYEIYVYTALASDNLSDNDTASMTIVSLRTPASPVAQGVSIPYASSTTLSATSPNTMIWYDSPTSHTELARGSYTTPTLYATDTFYVVALLETPATAEIGTGTASNSNDAAPTPFAYSRTHVKEQYLWTADELADLGEGVINSLAFNINTEAANVTMNNYTIKLGTTNATSLSTWMNGLQEVFSDDVTITKTPPTTGWKQMNFTAPFYYDGESNLVVEICYAASTTAGHVKTYNSNTPFVSTIVYHDNNNNACQYSGNPSASYTKRPNVQFGINAYGCKSEPAEVIVTVAAPPSCEAGLVSIVSPEENATVMSGVATPIEVELKNFGTDVLTSLDLHWTINGTAQAVYNWTGSLQQDATETVTIGNYTFASGEVELKVWLEKDCDSESSNDTVLCNFSSCIGNNNSVTTLTIGPDATDDYSDFTTLINDLTSSGICGPLQVNVKPGTYAEQLTLPGIAGLSDENYIKFSGVSADNSETVLTFAPATGAEDKYVLSLSGVENIHFENMTIAGVDTTAEAFVSVDNSSNVSFRQMSFTSQKTMNGTMLDIKKANQVELSSNTFAGSAVQLALSDTVSGVTVSGNEFLEFGISGIEANVVENLTVSGNYLSTDTSKYVVTAVSLRNLTGTTDILANNVYLKKGTAVRTGILLRNVEATQQNPAFVANNAVSMIGPRAASTALAYVGIDIDSTDWMNVYYNTVYLEPSRGNNTNSKCLAVGKIGSNLIIQNNNLDNSGKGYAMYVQTPGTQVILSNNNNYYTTGTKFVYWLTDKANLGLLQTANSMDAQSVSVENSFVNDSTLGLTFPTEIVRVAEPIDDVVTDIVGNFRPVSPKPTIGAYEYQFAGNDTGIPQIIDPIEGNEYVEGDPLTVQVELKNFGNYSISSVNIVAELRSSLDEETPIETISETWTGMLASLQSTTFTFTQTFTPPLNTPLTADLYVVVYTEMEGDELALNDTAYTHFRTIPAKDLKLDGTVQITERCTLTDVAIQTKIKNDGERIVGPGDAIQVSYWIEDRPDLYVTEMLTFPYTDITNGTTFQNLQPGASLTYTFTQHANLYPLGTVDVAWRLWTSVSTVGDNNHTNDTASSSKTVNSKVSPPAPTVTDDYIPYATWGHPRAEQENNLVIKWYSSATATDPFYAPTNYNASKVYTTSQLFDDTTFYVGVNATGSYPCASDRTAVTVHLDPRAAVDASAVAIVEPPADAWVYMTTGDTIKVLLTNYGTQPLSNFPVTYSVKPTSPSTAEAVEVTETCTATILPDQQYVFAFNTLADMSVVGKTYAVTAWTNAAGDYTALNDTTNRHLVNPKNGSTLYCTPNVANVESLDITRVMLGTMDNPTTASGNGYSNFTNDATVTVPVLYKGISDQMEIHVDNSSLMEAESVVTGALRVFIDWNRNGVFEDTECVLVDTAYSGSVSTATVNVPANTLTGLTRMRVILKQAANTTTPFSACEDVPRGEIEDYKVFVKSALEHNAELKRFASPTELATEGTTPVSVVMRNAGLSPMTSANIVWTFGNQQQTFSWNGNLASGAVETVTLGNVDLELGLNRFNAFVELAGDADNDNDTTTIDTYVFRTFIVPYSTSFDEAEGNDNFYAYNPSTTNPTNCWEMGTPAESNATIDAAYSEPNCWKTVLDGKYPKNNESILYSPIFDINVVKPDTMTFMLRKDAAAGNAQMSIEYLNWEGKWILLGSSEDPYAENWYNSEDGYFDGTKSWTKVLYSLDHLNYLFGTKLQFRFIFRSKNGTQKDGFAIDDFEIKRAKREQDAGIVSLTLEPTALPNYGSNYYPKVGIKNYGSRVLNDVQVCYISEGMYIPICESLVNANIEPDDVYEYTFETGTYLTVDAPDPFQICAYTRLNPTDVYSDNDSICQEIVIGPLQKDVGIVSINSPNAQIVSNDNIEVAIQIRNYGLDPVSELPVAYSVPGMGEVVETIYFNPPLYNGDEYVYRFGNTFHSSFGAVNLKCWTGLDGDYYHDNDTVYKRLEGMGTVRDLDAKSITIDDADPDNIGLQLVIMNRSSVGVDNITVGYFVNGDRDNAVEETYRLGTAIPAGAYGYHTFAARLPRANAPYARITAYVSVENENDRSNDTTSTLYMGYRDGVADSIFIEQTFESDCKVQLTAHNGGTLGGTTPVRAHLVLNGDYANQIVEDFTWELDEPNSRLTRYMTFSQRIPKNESGNYDVIAWIEYPYDADHRNDTTIRYAVRSYVGLDEVAEVRGFELEQNQPNPFSEQTLIGFTLPEADEATLMVTNNLGQVVKTIKGAYPEGRSTIVLKDLDLPEGVYYYTMYYRGEKQVRKMIIVK